MLFINILNYIARTKKLTKNEEKRKTFVMHNINKKVNILLTHIITIIIIYMASEKSTKNPG